jgi:hypothetical protein
MVERKYISKHSESRYWVEINIHLQIPAALPRVKTLATRRIKDWNAPKFSLEAVMERKVSAPSGREVRLFSPRARRLVATPGHNVFLYIVQWSSLHLDFDSYKHLASGDSCFISALCASPSSNVPVLSKSYLPSVKWCELGCLHSRG